MTTILNYRLAQNPFIFAQLEHGPDISRDISKMVYTDSADDKATQMEITLNNKRNKYTDDLSFVTRNHVKIRWGYPNEFSPVYSFVLTRAQQSFDAATGPVLKVVAWDRSIDMNREARPFNWGPVSSSEIARKIAEHYDLRPVIEDSDDARKESRVQAANDTDIQYLKKLAAALDWDCYVEGRALHFHKRMFDEKPTNTYDYMVGRNPQVISFTPRVNLNKKTKTGKGSVDAKTGKPANPVVDQKLSTPLSKFYINADQQTGVLVTKPVSESSAESSAKVVAKHAAAKQQKIDMTAAEASMVIIGDSTVRSRQPVSVRGVGIHSGVWYVKEAKHEIGSDGYTTKLELQRNAIEKGYKDKKGRKAAGRGGKSSKADLEEEVTAIKKQVEHLRQMGLTHRIIDRPGGFFEFNR